MEEELGMDWSTEEDEDGACTWIGCEVGSVRSTHRAPLGYGPRDGDQDWEMGRIQDSARVWTYTDQQVFDEAQQRDGHDRAQKWFSHSRHHHL